MIKHSLFIRPNATVRTHSFWQYFARAMSVSVRCLEKISPASHWYLTMHSAFSPYRHRLRNFTVVLALVVDVEWVYYGLPVCVVFLYERVEVPSCHRAPFPPNLHQLLHFLIRTKETERWWKRESRNRKPWDWVRICVCLLLLWVESVYVIRCNIHKAYSPNLPFNKCDIIM